MDERDYPTARPLQLIGGPKLPRRNYARQKLLGLQPMELDWRIAALIGAGLTDDKIASVLGVETKIVKRVRREVPEDEDLKAIVDRARSELIDDMLEGAAKALQTAVAGLDGYMVSAGKGQVVHVDCQPQQAIAVFRELAKATGLGEIPTRTEEGKVTEKVNFKDPKDRVAALKALQAHALSEEKRRDLASRDPLDVPALPSGSEVPVTTGT